jgi:hypothetical protein
MMKRIWRINLYYSKSRPHKAAGVTGGCAGAVVYRPELLIGHAQLSALVSPVIDNKIPKGPFRIVRCSR